MRIGRGQSRTPLAWAAPMTALLAAAFILAACGGDDAGEQDHAAVDEATEDASTEDTATAAEDDGDDTDGATDEDAAAQDGTDGQAPATDRAIDTSLTGEDGWNEPLDLDIPDPGNAVLDFAGQRYDFEVSCFGTGEIPDTIMDGNRPLNEFLLFNFAIRGSGQTDDGRNVRIDAIRGIFVAGDRALQIRNMEWGGEGQLDRLVFSGLGQASSLVQSPSSADPAGDRLPVVRVTPDGVVTAEGELTREFADDTDAPEGPFTFAGRCQDAWPQDELDAAGG